MESNPETAATDGNLDRQRAGAETWGRYLRDRDHHSRNTLIVFYAPLVKFVAGRVSARLPSWMSFDDLVSSGTEGLIDAIENFNPDHGVLFESFASHRIKGAMLDTVRRMDHLPRSVRRTLRVIDDGTDELTTATHRTPTEADLAAHLSLDRRTIHRARALQQAAYMLSLDELTRAEDGSRRSVSLSSHVSEIETDRSDPAHLIEEVDEMARIAQAIRQLSDREQAVVALYYLEGLSLTEVGDILGVSESRISQIHSAAISKVRSALGVVRVLGSSQVHTKNRTRAAAKQRAEALAS